jgi:hypothetical protein
MLPQKLHSGGAKMTEMLELLELLELLEMLCQLLIHRRYSFGLCRRHNTPPLPHPLHLLHLQDKYHL